MLLQSSGALVELRVVAVNAAPPYKRGAAIQGMQLTVKSVTPFAFAKVAPLLLAADPKC